MKKILRNIALVAISFLAFSCSDDTADEKSYGGSIYKILSAAPQFSSFTEALEVTGMDAMLKSGGNYTVFAPTDDAFASVLNGLTVDEFNTANPGVLEEILKYHIVNSVVLSKDFTDGQEITTSQGQTLMIDLEANSYYPEYDMDLGGYEETSIYVNSARVYGRDAQASNGRIDVIDVVLTPAIGG